MLLVFFLTSIWKFLTKYNNINSIFQSDKFLQIYKCEPKFMIEIIFRSGLNDIFYYECPLKFAFKSEFNSSAEVIAFSAMKIIYDQLLTV